MNHLAHLLLAGSDPDSIIGNLAGDYVKGPLDKSWPPALRAGIELHRRVDSYTDAHETVRAARSLFTRRRRRFAGVIMDVAFDHFLSLHWSEFHDQNRRGFIDQIYETLKANHHELPVPLRNVAPIMIRRDWLAHCETLVGAGVVLDRIATRSERARPLHGAIREVEENLRQLETTFLEYFPDAIAFAMVEKARLKEKDRGF